jgi:YegS/Rv2252/BmrU family lipid kinase
LVTVIINPVSGGATPEQARVRADLAARVIAAAGEAAEVFVTQGRGHARELAAAAVHRGARLVYAWGGDGTINEVASSLLHCPAALAVVPSGSGNGLARELRVSRRPEQAISEALAAPPRPIDVGEFGGRLFVSVAGVGFDAHVAACFDRDNGRRGFTTYVRITARELLTYQACTYRLGADARRALTVTIANAPQFGNGARIAPQAVMDDGLLDLVVVEARPMIETIWGVPRLFTGGINKLRGVSTERIERATIESDQPMCFHVDGEPVQGGTRLEAGVLPGALKLAVR